MPDGLPIRRIVMPTPYAVGPLVAYGNDRMHLERAVVLQVALSIIGACKRQREFVLGLVPDQV
jgi:hypothetical protein